LAHRKSPDTLAVGLGQFMPTTWLQFVKENKEVVRRICGRVPWTRGGKLELRTNPELGIWATTWLAAKSAKGLNIDKASHHSGEPGKGVDESNAYEIYLTHAWGLGGYVNFVTFFEGKMSFEQNKEEVEARTGKRVPPWQNEKDATFIRDYAKKLEQKAQSYAGQIGDTFSPSSS
jgi:hypothetical protein